MAVCMKKLSLAILLAVSTPAFACSAISPEFGFVHQFDKNKDGALSRTEFKKVKATDNYQIKFDLKDKHIFNRLDKNYNGKISADELQNLVDYVRHPCADWEEMMTKMAQEELAKRPIIRIYELTVLSEYLAEFHELGANNIRQSVENEDGVLAMYVLADDKNANKIYVFEAYANQSAYEAHINSAHFKEWQSKTKHMMSDKKMIETLPIIFGSKAIDVQH